MKCENCTKSECSKKKKKNESGASEDADPLAVAFADGEENEFHRLTEARIFLSDCMACGNCVTSEEGAQIFAQNQKAFFKVLNLNKKCDTSLHRLVVASVSPQSVPYFAVKFRLSVCEAARKLCGFLKSLGVQHVFDTTIAADFSILETQRDFIQRFRRQTQDEHAFPMFASACPGWMQYAERVLGDSVTPHICTAKSTQQIMGSLVKGYFASHKNLSPDKIFHLTIAPCYDRKMEALREDYYTALYKCRDVDCVLTSGEIMQIMEQRNFSIKEVEASPLENVFAGNTCEFVRHEGIGSDGYLAHIFRHAAKELFDMDVKEITYKTLKNKDFQEVCLEKDGETVLRFAAAYGFRNIQNMVLKLRKGKFHYHFVEVLACPGGCLNGKGQAQTLDGKPERATLHEMEEAYTLVPVQSPENNPHIQELYLNWLEGAESQKTREMLHTKLVPVSQAGARPDMKW
ncbi:nuclear prelamin A recognition factor [Pelobates cultripes]|uniref:Nuclear prelamin A recognition factor n=2 Tax=Pelobates cultripes TaxID=61616 RepID=A0AAD1S4H0_PELCU|nr:nuclear prelamin A recognition factor [Pelobates cultripes]